MVSLSIPFDTQHDNRNEDETSALIRSSFFSAASDAMSYGTTTTQQQQGDDVDPSAISPVNTPETVDVTTSTSSNTSIEAIEQAAGASNDNDSVDGDAAERSGTLGTLARRLRCLFSTITWPIVPLGTIVALALLWVLYAASSLDLRRSCSHPLHSYAVVSLVLVAYIPHHGNTRSQLFQYSRERDGPIRPARVRMYDQFFHTICLLYVYSGVTLIQTCNDDIVTPDNIAELLEKYNLESFPADTPLNTCSATCPNLYQALTVYVATLEMFTFALILPLLFLPCIYLWFLRRATAEAEAFAHLQDRLQEEEALLSNGGITASEILDSLEDVKLVARPSSDGTGESEVWILPSCATSSSNGTSSNVKECCICMNEFGVQNEEGGDVETGFQVDGGVGGAEVAECDTSTESEATDPKESSIVRTRCGHVFHKECLAGWVGGRWSVNPQNPSNDDGPQQDRRRRRARQTCCPLCRKDLRLRTSGSVP